MGLPKKGFIKVIFILPLLFTVSCYPFFWGGNQKSCDKVTEYEKQAEKLKLELELNPPQDYVQRMNIEEKIRYLLEQRDAERAKCHGWDKKKGNMI